MLLLRQCAYQKSAVIASFVTIESKNAE